MTIEDQVRQFQLDRRGFDQLREHFQYVCDKFYSNLSRKIGITRDEFQAEYTYVLLKALLKFDAEKAKSEQKQFERYIVAAMHKLAVSLRRQARRLKKHKTVSLEIDAVDERAQIYSHKLEVIDTIQSCISQADRPMVALRLMGNSVEEVCHLLKIRQYQYRTRMTKVRQNQRLLKVLLNK